MARYIPKHSTAESINATQHVLLDGNMVKRMTCPDEWAKAIIHVEDGDWVIVWLHEDGDLGSILEEIMPHIADYSMHDVPMAAVTFMDDAGHHMIFRWNGSEYVDPIKAPYSYRWERIGKLRDERFSGEIAVNMREYLSEEV